MVLLTVGLLRASEKAEPVAVFAQVFNGYKRTQLPDNSFKPETYTFGEGGCWTRPVTDAENKEMTFLRVAQAVATPLGRVNFVPSRNAKETDLLILVFWGATSGTRNNRDPGGAISQAGSAGSAYAMAQDTDRGSTASQPSAATAAAEIAYNDAVTAMLVDGAQRDKIDSENARILGYTEVLDRAKFAAHMSFAQDIMSDVANNRYYVVLHAYDFKTAVKEKKLKPLWTARISMDENGNNFGRSLDHMLRSAAPYFGQDSDGLHREANREGRVEIGPAKVVEMPAAK